MCNRLSEHREMRARLGQVSRPRVTSAYLRHSLLWPLSHAMFDTEKEKSEIRTAISRLAPVIRF